VAFGSSPGGATESAAPDSRVAALSCIRVVVQFRDPSENKMSGWPSGRCSSASSSRGPRRPFGREARAGLEVRIAAEQARKLTTSEAKELALPHLLALFTARDLLDQLATVPVEEIPTRIQKILAAIPRADGATARGRLSRLSRGLRPE
jgi:hypothetical protein